MECNRDEALRAKGIAERKFLTKDIPGAKKFALKAQTLFPELEGITQMIATLDIYLAAENKINGESDFYGILGVSPVADDKTVRGHYRNLALSLHPDKNKSIGADGAFKYISEAWSLLSDKARRKAYDQKRNTNTNQNGFYNFTKSTTTTTNKTPNATTSQTNLKTFWTVCHACKMQYEYLRMYLHQNLLCPNCHEPFLAIETPAPNTKVSTKGFKSSKISTKNQARHKKGENVSDYTTHQWGPFSKTTTTTTTPASSVQAATLVQRAYERVKREREEAQAAIKREEALKRKKKRSGNLSSSGHHTVVDLKKGVLSNDVNSLLVHKARTEIKKRLSQWKSETLVNYKVDRKQEEEQKQDSLSRKNTMTMTPLLIDVQDPDFHNFDRERSEGRFREGEIWAVYDDDDGMPRNYAFIHKKAFGEFRIGKHQSLCFPNYFSHKVNFKKMENGSFEVYPRKGEVWALYREWNQETRNEFKHKYEIVQVDECDEEEEGFKVTQLVKVAGFKTVFHRQINVKDRRVIPESEITRFSHQIPSYFLTGQESLNAPKGCCELDPAAVPDEFLQVIAVQQEEEEENIHDHDDESAVLADVKEVVNLDDEVVV
ncbi:unnamed protein product [Lactuca virosa]|uniref:J domain-containing protein n=1 Tax=Lactuca virosa TaxID=75947 RepID=A0AAU9LP07_9ASTR|nr:unnamed protein product [Lactuca virosa]